MKAAGHHSTVTSAQREEFWRRYKAGEAFLWISRELGQRPSTSTGCFKPLVVSSHRAVTAVDLHRKVTRDLH